MTALLREKFGSQSGDLLSIIDNHATLLTKYIVIVEASHDNNYLTKRHGLRVALNSYCKLGG
jgi:hypothetical protein